MPFLGGGPLPEAKQSLNELLHEIRRIQEHREVLTEKKIRKIYKNLVKDLNAFVAEYYVKYADGEGALTIAKLQEKMKYAKFLEEIDNNVNFFMPLIHKEILDLTEQVYRASYEGMEKAVNKSYKLKELKVSPEVMKRAVANNIEKLTPLPALLEKNRAAVIYDMKQVINVGLLNGDRYETMARKILEKIDINYGRATNIVRTETHRNIETGYMDCAQEINKGLDDSELVYVKIYRNVGDERVRPQQRYKTKKGWKTSRSRNGANHINIDGQVRKVDEPFEYSDGCKAMNPGGIELPARHVCNCRCFVEYDLMTKKEYEKLRKSGGKAR